MKTPERVSLDQLREALIRFFDDEIVLMDETMFCRKCKDIIKRHTTYISIHATEFGSACTGNGICEQFPIPYCPTCEPTPADHGCVHVPYVTMRNAGMRRLHVLGSLPTHAGTPGDADIIE